MMPAPSLQPAAAPFQAPVQAAPFQAAPAAPMPPLQAPQPGAMGGGFAPPTDMFTPGAPASPAPAGNPFAPAPDAAGANPAGAAPAGGEPPMSDAQLDALLAQLLGGAGPGGQPPAGPAAAMGDAPAAAPTAAAGPAQAQGQQGLTQQADGSVWDGPAKPATGGAGGLLPGSSDSTTGKLLIAGTLAAAAAVMVMKRSVSQAGNLLEGLAPTAEAAVAESKVAADDLFAAMKTHLTEFAQKIGKADEKKAADEALAAYRNARERLITKADGKDLDRLLITESEGEFSGLVQSRNAKSAAGTGGPETSDSIDLLVTNTESYDLNRCLGSEKTLREAADHSTVQGLVDELQANISPANQDDTNAFIAVLNDVLDRYLP